MFFECVGSCLGVTFSVVMGFFEGLGCGVFL